MRMNQNHIGKLRNFKETTLHTIKANISVKMLKQACEDIKNKTAPADRLKFVDNIEPSLFAQVGARSITFYCQQSRDKKINLGKIKTQVPPREFIADLRDKSRAIREELRKEKEEQKIERSLPASQMTLRQFLKHHYVIETAIDGGLKTKENQDVKRIYRDFASMMDKKMVKFTRGDIQEWLVNYKPHLSSSTKRRSYSCLRSLFNHAVNKNLIHMNPIAGIKIKEENQAKYKVLNEEQIKAIIENVSKRSERDRIIFQILMITGCRTGELFPIKVEDIIEDGEQSRIKIFNTEVDPRTNKRQINKANKYREVQIGIGVYNEIKQFLNNAGIKKGFIFIGLRGEPLKSFRSPMRTIRKQTGIDFTLYDFRHTFASTLVKKGKNLIEIRDRMGHSSIIQTVAYIDKVLAKDEKTIHELSDVYNLAALSVN